MRKVCVIAAWVFAPLIGWGQTSADLGPLGDSNSTVNAADYDQFRSSMETAIRELGRDGFIRILWENGMSAAVPSGATPVAVTTQRYDRLLNPRNKNSLYRMVGLGVIRHSIRRDPPALPPDPLMVSVFVATASDTFTVNRTNQVRAKVEGLRTPLDLEGGAN